MGGLATPPEEIRMSRWLPLALLAFVACAAAADDAAKQDSVTEEIRKLPWIAGPTEAKIGDKATLKLTQDYQFLEAPGSKKFLQLLGNPPSDNHYTLVPTHGSWFAVFSFSPDGYVKDDEKIDADKLLQSMKEGEKESNEERKRLGLSQMYLDGWEVPPHYDTATKRLEWGKRLHDEHNEQVINYTVRLLGRTGIMSATLVDDPAHLSADVAAFRDALSTYEYVPGERYAEFRSGDRVAEYGLAALIAGGAAAAVVKTGAGKGLLKLIGLGAVAVFGAVAGVVKKLRGRATPSA
jgi:uncharacterized membrane-anchored protein